MTVRVITMTKQFRRALVAAVSVPVFAVAACGSPGPGMDHGSGGMGSAPSGSTSASGAVNPADIMFAVMMIPHHEQAVEMSDLLLDASGVDPDVRQLAEQITAAQQPEIEQMKGWLEDWGVDESTTGGMDHSGHMDGMLTEEQIEALRAGDGPTAQKLYLEGMIEHHQGAVEMAENVLAVTRDAEVTKLAEAIVVSQRAEITTMEKMLAR